MNRDRSYLQDILEAIAGIERHVGRGRQAFDEDETLQAWMTRQLQNIGEASRSLSERLRDAHPEVPWLEIIRMRNTLVHRYFGVDMDIVWSAVERDVPVLRGQVEAILTSLPEDEDTP